jgi:hypothetical protein
MASSVTWACPQCGRRVPNRAESCHCGCQRSAAEALRGSQPAGSGGLGWQLKALLALLGLLVVIGAGLLFVPSTPQPGVPLLGWIDQPPSTPQPSHTPRPPRRRR